MAKRQFVLPLLGALFVLGGVAQVAGMVGSTASAPAVVEGGLLAGCRDIPEVVELVALHDLRASRLEALKAAIERQRADIAIAEGTLTSRLRQLKALKDGQKERRDGQRREVREDIDRVVAVYDQMKPRDAAQVLTNLPPDFAAEILMRVEPDTGAQIIAAVDPAQAAILTTHMSARRAAPN